MSVWVNIAFIKKISTNFINLKTLCDIMREAKDFYRLLSIFCFTLSGLMIIRRVLLVEYILIQLLTGLFWPIVGLFIGLKFLKMDGYTMTVQEGAFYVFVLYCSFYFLIDMIIIIFILALAIDLTIITLNVVITIMGWLAILSYVFF